MDKVVSLPSPFEKGAVHAYADAPFGAFANRVRQRDPLWGLAKDWPAAFATNTRAIEWLLDMAPEHAAGEVSKLPEPHRTDCVEKIRHGTMAWDEDAEDWTGEPVPAHTWFGIFCAELNTLTTGTLL